MRHLILLLLCLTSVCALPAQTLSLFDVDASSFPLMKAKFFYMNAAGQQMRPSVNELAITDNGFPRAIMSVSYPALPRPTAWSLAMSIDVSRSMSSRKLGEVPLELGKTTAIELCNSLVMPPSEVALQTCNDRAFIVQDFTTSRSTILSVIPPIEAGGYKDFVEHLLNQNAGLLNFAKTGSQKRVAVLYTDASWYDFTPEELQRCKDTCAKHQIQFIGVIYSQPYAEPNGPYGIKKSLQELASATGGFLFDGINSISAAKEIAAKIPGIIQGEPCEITWQSGPSCKDGIGVVECRLLPLNLTSKARYSVPRNTIMLLGVAPTFINYGLVTPGATKDTSVTLVAQNADFTVTNIVRVFGSTAFTIVNATFPLTIAKGNSQSFTLRFSPTDSSMSYGSFEIQTDMCPFSVSASGGFPHKKMATPTIKITHPIGGETFVVGGDSVVTWDGVAPSDTVKIEYSIDGGRVWTMIANDATGLRYVWKNIPGPANAKCIVRVSQSNNGHGAKRPGTLLYTLVGHTGNVWAAEWSPDGTKVTTASTDHTAKVWNAYTGTQLFTLNHTAWVKKATWNPAGSVVATPSGDSTVKLWDVTSGALLNWLIGHKSSVNAVKWSPDGSKVATASNDGTAKIWDATLGMLIFTLAGHIDYVIDVVWSPDGDRVATTSSDGTAKIWDAAMGTLLYTLAGHSGEIYSANWSPDGSRVATASTDDTAIIWDATKGTLLSTLASRSSIVYSVTWSPDGSRVATAGGRARNTEGDSCAIIWDATTGTELFVLAGYKFGIIDANWSPDGSRIATAGGDGTAKIWDVTTGRLITVLAGHRDLVNTVTWSTDGARLATSCFDRTAKIWFVDDTPLQEDVSSEFNVVMPSPLSNDVDMQQCLVGSAKDSVVVDGIRNSGTYPFRTDSVFFTGADAGAFRLVSGIPPFDVAASAARPLEFRFAPKRVGLHSADIVMITQADTLVQKIQGIGIASSLAIVNNIIDFGRVLVGASKDTLNALTITNVGSAPLTITATRHAGPNDVDFTTLAGGNAFTLNAGDTAKVDLRFSPSTRGRTSGRLLFDYNGFGSPAMVQLFAEGMGPDTARTTIALDNINAQAGEKVNLVLKLDKQSGLQLANSPTDWFARIHYNPTILFNEQTNNVCLSVSSDSCTIELTGTYNPASTVLASIPCVATLGTTDRAALAIETFVWTNGNIETETQLIDGVITVTGICEDGGVRLFTTAGSSTSLASRPNPVKDELRIDYGLVSETSVTLTLTSSTGQVAQTIVSNKPHSAGRYDVVQDVSSLSSGIYYLTLRTNARTLTSRVDIVK